ncbi:MAG: glycosyltransferase [Deltaproteobacteria bacterium]|nr:glycosyltransferase [Deltaproteobacteria bacterium]
MTATNDAPTLSIVIPVYNEEKILPSAVAGLREGLRELGIHYELILAENGSKDATREIGKTLSEKFPEVSMFSASEPNYGKALREGILRARGEFVVCDEIDLCLTDFYRAALALLQGNECDFVVGSKLLGESNDDRPWTRHAASMVYNGLLRVTLGFKGTDTHGIKAFRRTHVIPVVEACLVDKDVFASELVLRAERSGMRMREIPIALKEVRPPSVNLIKRVPNVLKALGKLVWAIRVQG